MTKMILITLTLVFATVACHKKNGANVKGPGAGTVGAETKAKDKAQGDKDKAQAEKDKKSDATRDPLGSPDEAESSDDEADPKVSGKTSSEAGALASNAVNAVATAGGYHKAQMTTEETKNRRYQIAFLEVTNNQKLPLGVFCYDGDQSKIPSGEGNKDAPKMYLLPESQALIEVSNVNTKEVDLENFGDDGKETSQYLLNTCTGDSGKLKKESFTKAKDYNVYTLKKGEHRIDFFRQDSKDRERTEVSVACVSEFKPSAQMEKEEENKKVKNRITLIGGSTLLFDQPIDYKELSGKKMSEVNPALKRHIVINCKK